MEHAIEIKHLCKDYKLFKLEDVSFTVPGGSIVGLIGENGAGKSTTIKSILGLIRPDSGEVEVLDVPGGSADRAVREDIGVVLDECHFYGALTANHVGKIMGKLYQKWDQNLYLDYLKKFDLPRNLFLKEFSRGMKMKLSIAAALAHHPRLLILDEATSGLDPVVRDELLDEFLAFIRDEDHSILISSHITSDLEKCADYIVYLHKGKVAIQGAKDELLDQYGRLVCTKEELEQVDRALLVGVRRSSFSCEALVRDRHAFCRRYPSLTVDRVSLEDMMVFTVRGDEQ